MTAGLPKSPPLPANALGVRPNRLGLTPEGLLVEEGVAEGEFVEDDDSASGSFDGALAAKLTERLRCPLATGVNELSKVGLGEFDDAISFAAGTELEQTLCDTGLDRAAAKH